MRKWLSVIQFVVPFVIAAVNPALAPLGGVIVHGIDSAEALADAKGADKLAHAVALSKAAAEGVNAATGRVVVDPAAVEQSAAQVISASVSIANLLSRLGTPVTLAAQ